MTKPGKTKSPAKVRSGRKRKRARKPKPVQAATVALQVQELLPPEDGYESALAAVKTERSRCFVREFVSTWPQLNATEAARRAGCSMRIAYQTGHEWRHRPDIARAVKLWIRERLERALPPSGTTQEQQAEQVIRTAWLTARANPLWFTRISPDGKSFIPDLGHATDEQLAVIESFDTVERIVGGDTLEVRTRVKLQDKGRALALLARAFGLDRQEAVLAGKVEVKVTYDDRPKEGFHPPGDRPNSLRWREDEMTEVKSGGFLRRDRSQ